MYIPRSFAEHDQATLFDFIDVHPLGILVSAFADGMVATHLPLLLDRDAGPSGTLLGHAARANPHARPDPGGLSEALVIFSGADAYVTPRWYATKAETGRVVPTWNYVAVHVYGTLRLHDDATLLHGHLERLTQRHEEKHEHPWHVGDAPAEYIEQQMKAIVAVSLEITRIEGKWKMSQNRTDADIDGVIDGLSRSASPRDQEVAAIVAARRPGGRP